MNEFYVETLDTYDTPVDFIVNVKTRKWDNDLLYYDREENHDSRYFLSYKSKS